MNCKVCGFVNPSGAIACQACGTAFEGVTEPAARVGDAVCATHKDRPALAPCDRCGTFYCGGCLLRGADGKLLCETCRTRETLLPWDARAERGMIRAWWDTSVLLLKAPQITLQTAPREGTLGSSLLFVLLSTIAGFATTFAIYGVIIAGAFVVGAQQSSKLEGGSGLGPAAGVAIGVVGVVIYAIVILGMQLGSVFILAGIEHVVLRMLGEQTTGNYSVTVRAHALGLAPFVIGLFPFCGPMVMGIWSLVIRVIALSSLQRVSTGKAVVAVLAPLAVMCLCFGGLYAVAIALALGSAGMRT